MTWARLPLVVVPLWWGLLFVADSAGWDRDAYYWFFVRSGGFPPNELFGSSFAAVVLVFLLSLAAFVGLVHLLFASRLTRLRRSGLANTNRRA